MSKRILALLLAGIIAISLVACTGTQTKNEAATTDPLTKDDVIQIYISSSGSWPYKEDWKVWEYIKEGIGGTLDITDVPLAETSTKWPILFASPDLLPDLMTDSRTSCPYRGADNVAIDINTLLDYMPNYVAWRDSLNENDYNAFILPNVDTENRMYSAPTTGHEAGSGERAWLYRKDIFEKHNLKIPTTFDELYEVCKELKKLYPDSYPFCQRDLLSNMAIFGPSFNKYWEPTYYYDYDDNTWKYGALDDTMLEVIEFFKKMIDEDLVPPNAVSIAVSEWQELVTSDRGFIMFDYNTRIDNFNSTMSTSGTDFLISAFEPPVANKEKGLSAVARQSVPGDTVFICNSRNDKRIANAAKYLDWFYTDEATELVSWGKEGETYEVVDGKRVFITDETGAIPKVLFGFQTAGAGQRKDISAINALDTKELAAVKPMILEHTLELQNPRLYMTFNPDESRQVIDTNVAINTYLKETVSKMLLGQLPLTHFEQFKKDLVDLGVNDVLAFYENAYNKITAK